MRFHEQMKKLRNEEEDRYNIFPNTDWTLQDFKDLFSMIEEGYLVQEESCWFIINEEWDREDIYKEEFEEEEEEEKELPEELKEWVLENMKAVEEHTLEEDKAMLFINFLEENQHNPTFIKLYNEYEKSKN